MNNLDPDDVTESLEGVIHIMPQRRVKVPDDMEKWQRSQAYYDLMGFINGISTAVQGMRLTDTIYVSEVIQNILKIFDQLRGFIRSSPPDKEPQRFGNRAYRVWAAKMHQESHQLLQGALPASKCEWISELCQYFTDSFGNAVRIDYGTGHELAFIFFMCALFKAEICDEKDSVACALVLFKEYLSFVRFMQKTYNMEPAGSQGVWSLDDYQFVPFIWGSAQLALNSPFEPANFLDEKIIDEYKDEYMFIGCIDYISKVKTGHFAEHSNQLWSITAVPSWSKINSGLVRMYEKEILSKYPIIQHVNFAKLMPFKPVKLGSVVQAARLGVDPARLTKPSLMPTAAAMMPPPRTSTVLRAERKVDSEQSSVDASSEGTN